MASFDPVLAETRFGCGLGPGLTPAVDAGEMMSRLSGPDEAAQRFRIEDFGAFAPRMARTHELRKALRKVRGTEGETAARKAIKLERASARKAQRGWLWHAMMRRAHTRDGLRERLAFFWSDHFTAVGKAGVLRRANAPYVEAAIRPHLTGSFAEMLRAVATQPLMLHYLDQVYSAGPNSIQAERTANNPRKKGLNENLAREILELHTLGVDGPYDQEDVRELAELLTGLSYSPQGGFKFRKAMVEPGAETVLGVSYGGGKAKLGDILRALDDLAHRPETGRHIARKLAVHFLGDRPEEDVVSHVAQRFIETGGNLAEVTAALLEHPAAWDGVRPGNVKQPVDFIGSTLRALAVPPEALDVAQERRISAVIEAPMTLMGQRWERPLGPDGWPEDDDAWITPQRMAARLEWAMTVPALLRPDLPDPRDFVETALGGRAPEELMFAARAAEDRSTGVGLILASPAFQRM